MKEQRRKKQEFGISVQRMHQNGFGQTQTKNTSWSLNGTFKRTVGGLGKHLEDWGNR